MPSLGILFDEGLLLWAYTFPAALGPAVKLTSSLWLVAANADNVDDDCSSMVMMKMIAVLRVVIMMRMVIMMRIITAMRRRMAKHDELDDNDHYKGDDGDKEDCDQDEGL